MSISPIILTEKPVLELDKEVYYYTFIIVCGKERKIPIIIDKLKYLEKDIEELKKCKANPLYLKNLF
jgi:hypothetical protein